MNTTEIIKMKQFNTAIELEDYCDSSNETTTLFARGLLTKSAAKEVKILCLN